MAGRIARYVGQSKLDHGEKKPMKIIHATILDATHVELSEPIAAHPGEVMIISIPDLQEAEQTWREATRQHFLEAYDDQDALYDDL